MTTELAALSGSVDNIFKKMEAKLMFKGVTYEILRSKFPNLKFAHEEYDAARQSKQGGRLNIIKDCG